MKKVVMLLSLCIASLLVFPAAAEQNTVTEKPAASASKKPTAATDKMVVKEAKEVDVLKVLAKPQGYVGSCGGCASNPTICCPSNARPVCESSGACSCWKDPHCQ